MIPHYETDDNESSVIRQKAFLTCVNLINNSSTSARSFVGSHSFLCKTEQVSSFEKLPAWLQGRYGCMRDFDSKLGHGSYFKKQKLVLFGLAL